MAQESKVLVIYRNYISLLNSCAYQGSYRGPDRILPDGRGEKTPLVYVLYQLIVCSLSSAC